MNNKQYREINALNASTLKACCGGTQYAYDYIHGQVTYSAASQVAMNLGSAAHTRLLEPHLFESEWCVSPKFDLRTTEGKANKKQFDESNAGKNIITDIELELINSFVTACNKSPAVEMVLREYEKEKSYQFDLDGISMKARLDLVSEKDNVIIDLKTTRDASPKDFTADIINMNYDVQMLHYAHAAMSVKTGGMPNIYVIALETTSGEIALYNITNIVFSNYTQAKYAESIKTYLTVKEMKERPVKYSKNIVSLELPYWVK